MLPPGVDQAAASNAFIERLMKAQQTPTPAQPTANPPVMTTSPGMGGPQGQAEPMPAPDSNFGFGPQQPQQDADALQKMLAQFGMPQQPEQPPQAATMQMPNVPWTGMGGGEQLGALTGAPGLQKPNEIGQNVLGKSPGDPMTNVFAQAGAQPKPQGRTEMMPRLQAQLKS